MNIIEVIGDRLVGKVPWNKRRSPKWGKTRKAYLKEHPACEVTGITESLEVHHVLPFYLFPELELDPSNLMTVTRKFNIHYLIGHLLNWKSFNVLARADALLWNNKIVSRPTERVNL